MTDGATGIATTDDLLDLTDFRTAVNSSFVPLKITTPIPDTFRGSVAQENVHGVTFTSLRADAHTVERTPELIRQSPRAFFKVSLQLEGQSELEQNGRRVRLGPSDMAIYDTSKPYVLRFTSPFRVMVIMLPHTRFDLAPGLVDAMTAVRLGGDEGLARVISPFLSQIGTDLGHLRGPAGAQLAQNAVDLLQTLFSNQLDVARMGSSPHWVLMQSIRDHIDEHLAEPDLSPGSIAAASFISTRHLHALFHEQGTTVSSYVRSRRLERCHRDLIDPAQFAIPIAVIGARWGFPDAAHFSRAFKAAYQESPAAVRRRVRQASVAGG